MVTNNSCRLSISSSRCIESYEGYKALLDWTWLLYGLLLVTIWIGAVVWLEQALYGAGFRVGTLGFRL
jgi:hypothetical protein